MPLIAGFGVLIHTKSRRTTQTNVLVLFIEQMSRLVAKIKNSDYD